MSSVILVSMESSGWLPEAFAAGLFARVRFDLSVQYGAAQPRYDPIVAQRERIAKVSVKKEK